MSWIHAVRERVANLFAPSDEGVDEEITHHLDLETQRQISAGADPFGARRRALDKFGDPRRIADATRAARGPDTFAGSGQDLRWAARSLRKTPRFTALALVTLAPRRRCSRGHFTIFSMTTWASSRTESSPRRWRRATRRASACSRSGGHSPHCRA
jgi:hypothetical protein